MSNTASIIAALRCTVVLASALVALEGQSPSFLIPQNIPIGPGCCSVLTGDFNGDGKADIVVAHSASNVIVLLGNGEGQFLPKETAQSQGPGSINQLAGIADINSDGLPDILAIADAGPV